MPVVKTADASTWDVVQTLKSRIPEMKSLLPDDMHISYEFDQSVFVMNAVKSLLTEGILGAILTGLMVLLFLRDWRSSLVVIITIPVCYFKQCVALKSFRPDHQYHDLERAGPGHRCTGGSGHRNH